MTVFPDKEIKRSKPLLKWLSSRGSLRNEAYKRTARKLTLTLEACESWQPGSRGAKGIVFLYIPAPVGSAPLNAAWVLLPQSHTNFS